MKIALSASFWNEPKVKKLLHECNRIYTTQVKNYERLHKEFGNKVCVIPDQCEDLLECLKEREKRDNPDVEFVTYVDLYKLHVSK